MQAWHVTIVHSKNCCTKTLFKILLPLILWIIKRQHPDCFLRDLFTPHLFRELLILHTFSREWVYWLFNKKLLGAGSVWTESLSPCRQQYISGDCFLLQQSCESCEQCVTPAAAHLKFSHLPSLIPWLSQPHTQATQPHTQAIPPHTQATPTSFPGYPSLIPRPPQPHIQVSPASYPGHPSLIP